MVQKTKVQVQHQLQTEETVQAVYIIQPMQQAEVVEEMYQALTDTMEHSMEQAAAEQPGPAGTNQQGEEEPAKV